MPDPAPYGCMSPLEAEGKPIPAAASRPRASATVRESTLRPPQFSKVTLERLGSEEEWHYGSRWKTKRGHSPQLLHRDSNRVQRPLNHLCRQSTSPCGKKMNDLRSWIESHS